MRRLGGKVAVVTGGARGQGRSHAVTLAADGADVVIGDAPGDIATVEYGMGTVEDMQETVRLVEKQGRRCLAAAAWPSRPTCAAPPRSPGSPSR